jgi:hypothetical protein
MSKYDDLLIQLEDEVLYSAGAIIRFAQDSDYARLQQALLRIRISLNTRATRYGFPELGDGWIRLRGQGPTPGWFGWRWKSTVTDKSQATEAPQPVSAETLTPRGN